MHKLILDYFITDQSLQHVSAPQSKTSSGNSKSLMMASNEGPKHVGVIDQ